MRNKNRYTSYGGVATPVLITGDVLLFDDSTGSLLFEDGSGALILE